MTDGSVTDGSVTDGSVPDGTVPDGTSDEGADVAGRLSTVLGLLIRLLRRQAPAEVGPGSLAALATLVRSGPMRQGDLAAREGVAPPTLTRMVAALEESGYVVRRSDDQDRRAVLVSVTEDGARVVRAARAARAVVLRDRLERLAPGQAQALLAALPALEALADDDAPQA